VIRAEQIKAAVASYYRYERQYPLVAFEVSSQLEGWAGEVADVLVVDQHRHLIEVEVKLSIADLKRDVKKLKHQAFRNTIKGNTMIRRMPTHLFYFAVPQEIANKVKPICDEFFPYAGIMAVNGLYSHTVEVYRNPKVLSGRRLDVTEALRMVRGQSATICRLATRIEELLQVKGGLEKQIKEYKDMERLEKGSNRSND